MQKVEDMEYCPAAPMLRCFENRQEYIEKLILNS